MVGPTSDRLQDYADGLDSIAPFANHPIFFSNAQLYDDHGIGPHFLYLDRLRVVHQPLR
jgi:hypothetical protein